MQPDTVGSFNSSVMIICIHNDNLLIPRHLICIHDFKKHFDNLSNEPRPSEQFLRVGQLCVGENTWFCFYVSSSQEEIWQHQSQKKHPTHYYCLCFVAITLAFLWQKIIGN